MWEQHTASLRGIEIHYQTAGEGEPLLLLHGFTGCSGDWAYAGRDELVKEYRLIAPDARGHGRSTTTAGTITHRESAADTLALLDHLGLDRCKAIGMSFGGNTLLHVATSVPGRIEAMVLVSATMHFPEQARALMRMTPAADQQPETEWASMRERHHLGDEQIRNLWDQSRAFADSDDDVNFTPEDLAQIRARTLIVYGDRDPLYPIEMGVALYRAIPQSKLWVVPGSGHGPIYLEAADLFAKTALAFLRDKPAEGKAT